jgi:ATP-dependent Lon protease
MDAMDQKLVTVFEGKVVRKDLLHRIKKGTNIPTFVLEFLLARYCASDDDAEIKAGLEAVLATLQENYVRPDEANAAQSRVATKGQHRFIDKVHVRYVEKERRHWAALENFASQRIAIAEKFYRDMDRLLEGGIWAEVTLAYNDMDDDGYAFYIEDLRPIQISRFDFEVYCEGRRQFTRDEWMNVLLRSLGLEPSKLKQRQKFHFMARLIALVEPNFNFIELGPRGTGKSYFFSEFSPYSTLLSGGQATKATLFYNNARRRLGLIGFWDTIAFDEVAGIKIKDPDAIQIMKDYMANGRFSRGVEVVADASLVFIGNIDHSVDQLVNSTEHDLFMPLPKELDLAVMDRFACYLPGWEMPKSSSAYLTDAYGLITDYIAEAFHYQFSQTNRYEETNGRIRLGAAVEGRDEKGIKKIVSGFLKILHPDGPPTDEEFLEYAAYAVESRRRVKEQMNKRKPDDEFALIDLSYFDTEGQEIVVHCPESRGSSATQVPARTVLAGADAVASTATVPTETPAAQAKPPVVEDLPGVDASEPASTPEEQHFTIMYGDTGHTYESIIGPYLKDARRVVVEDPYIRMPHQIQNFVRFCEAVHSLSNVKTIRLVTNSGESDNWEEINDKLEELKQSLLEADIELDIEFNANLHDREIRIDNSWIVKIGRGLDIYQRPDGWFSLGAHDLALRKCLETKVDIYHEVEPG